MDTHHVAQALRARLPQLVEAGVDLDTLAATALAAWTTPAALPPTAPAQAFPAPAAPTAVSNTALPLEYAAVCDVVDATWPVGYAAGVLAGHAVTAGYVAAAALDQAEPARPGMSQAHRALAHRLQAARVSSDALREYLTGTGWQHARTWRGATIFRATVLLNSAAGTTDAEVMVPPPGVRDHVRRILDVAATIAEAEDRDVASVLGVLAPPPKRGELSHAALRFLWQVYDTATELAGMPPHVRDPGPSTNEHLTAYADWGDGTETSRLVAAARVGYQHGFRHGHGDGSWSAGAQLLTQVLRADNPQPLARIDGLPAMQWLRETDTDARWAADAVLHGRQPAQAPPSFAGRAFGPLTPGLSTSPGTANPGPQPSASPWLSAPPDSVRQGRRR